MAESKKYIDEIGGEYLASETMKRAVSVELTEAEYAALTEEEKNSNTVYYIKDGKASGSGGNGVISQAKIQEAVQTLIESGVVDISGYFKNDLTTTEEGYALDARQGKVLNEKITNIELPVVMDGATIRVSAEEMEALCRNFKGYNTPPSTVFYYQKYGHIIIVFVEFDITENADNVDSCTGYIEFPKEFPPLSDYYGLPLSTCDYRLGEDSAFTGSTPSINWTYSQEDKKYYLMYNLGQKNKTVSGRRTTFRYQVLYFYK